MGSSVDPRTKVGHPARCYKLVGTTHVKPTHSQFKKKRKSSPAIDAGPVLGARVI